ncbi:MAG TPA: alpha/beta hydrolase [Pseudolysinimonas sp.]|jgi:acetyl esterase/lipase
MNLPTLMTKVAALRGHPLAVSSTPAPLDDSESVVIPGESRPQAKPPTGLVSRRNVEFARRPKAGAEGSPIRLRMDILSPRSAGPLPLVVYIPGGGFVVAPKIGGARLRRYVAATGYVVASIEYRTTSTGGTFRDGIADVRAAIGFLRAHAEEYGIDPARVAVWGESAGGYLAAMVGVTNGHERFDPDGAGEVLAVVDKFGGSSLDRLAEGFDERTVAAAAAPGSAPARYVHGPTARSLEDDVAELRAADPISYVTAGPPAFLLFHGTNDRIISPVQTAALHHALLAAGAASTRYLVEGAGHGDIAVTSGEEKLWTTEPMLRLIVEFLDRQLSAAR